MRTAVVLIDFESVQPSSLAALEPDCFRVVVFVGASQAKLSFEIADAMQRMGERAEYVKISGHGKNALDFHIAYFLGQATVADPAAYYHIVSKDKGFDPLIDYLKSNGIRAARIASMTQIPGVAQVVKKTPAERLAILVEKFSNPKQSKPRSRKTLASSIAAHFQKMLTGGEVEQLIDAMEEAGHIAFENNRVTYAIPEAGD